MQKPKYISHQNARLLPILLISLSLNLLPSCQWLLKKEAVTARAPAASEGSAMKSFEPEMVNSSESEKRGYVVLVSIDGYRFDYNQTFHPPHLSQIQKDSISSEGLKPIYPSKTLPNHYAMATGLRADRNGIVSNEFYDPDRHANYMLKDRKSVEDGSWYFGEPMWSVAERQGMRTASFFWVGSEAPIMGRYPNYYYYYNIAVSYEWRVDQVVQWLELPPAQRPHLITLYFPEVDVNGHLFGPDSPQVRDAVLRVDEAIGRLQAGIAKTELPVNLIIVSDHGMEALDPSKIATIDPNVETKDLLGHFEIMGKGPQMILYLKDNEDKKLIAQTQTALENVAHRENGRAVYRVLNRSQRKRLRYATPARTGDLVIEPDAPWMVGLASQMPATVGGNHGWDPAKSRKMLGLFLATGPAFRSGAARLPVVDNVDIYPLTLQILGLKVPTDIDGNVRSFRKVLRR